MSWAIRDARPDERAMFLEIGREAYGRKTVAEDAGSRVRVAMVHGQVCGFARLTYAKAPVTAELGMLVVFERWRERGVGRRLVSDLCTQAAVRGDRRLRIVAEPWAEGFFRRVGATRTGVEAPDQLTPWYRPLFEIELQRALVAAS